MEEVNLIQNPKTKNKNRNYLHSSYTIIIAFDVKVIPEAQELVDVMGVKIFIADNLSFFLSV